MTAARWRRLAIGLAAALALALIGLCYAVLDGEDSAPQGTSAVVLRQAEVDAEAAARAAAVRLTTYDYTTADTDFDWVDAAGTARFRQQFAVVSEQTKKVVLELKVHAEGTVDDAAATAQDPDRVTVLLFVDQTLTSDASSERSLATPRVRMSMVREGDTWLVDEAEIRNPADLE